MSEQDVLDSLDAAGPPPAGGAEDQANEREAGPCPVLCLGTSQGRYLYLTPMNEVLSLEAGKHNRLNIAGLFAPRIDWLRKRWPSRDAKADAKAPAEAPAAEPGAEGGQEVAADASAEAKPRRRRGNPDGWNAYAAAEWLMSSCARRGIIDPAELECGVGTWSDPDTGQLVVHCGDAVLVDGRWQPPGLVGRRVYSGRASLPHPADRPAGRDEIEVLRGFLGTWNWSRPEIEPDLVLGWICVAYLIGVLDWRSSIWVTGQAGSGKSALLKLIHAILRGWLLHEADPTPAYIRDRLAGAARPVSIDEREPEADPGQEQAIMKLVRIASTRGGGGSGRSSARHETSSVQMNTALLFSSTLRPSLSATNLQRLALINLEPLENRPNVRLIDMNQEIARFADLGPCIHRRLIDRLPMVQAGIELYRKALVASGHKIRGADQYGTLLGAAAALCGDDLPTEEVIADAVRALDPGDLALISDEAPDHERCLDRLLTSHPDILWRSGQRSTVGEMIAEALDIQRGVEAAKTLRRMGLAVHRENGETWLAVANAHQGLASIYSGTHWAQRPDGSGVWMQALRNIPGARPRVQGISFGGRLSRCTLVPIGALKLGLPGETLNED